MKRIIFFVILIALAASFSRGFSQGGNTLINTKTEIIEYLEFREVDIKDVLRQLAKQYNLNIVFSESVTGYITVQLHSVTVEEALDSIITINGFVYTRKGNVIKVTTPQEAERESKVTTIFRLNNADASTLKTSLSKVLSADGSIEVDIRSNALIITDIPAVMAKIDEMLPQLDEATPQVLIEAKFIESTLGTTEALGIEWSTQMALTGSARRTTLPFPADTGENSIMKKLFPMNDPADIAFDPNEPYSWPYVGEGTPLQTVATDVFSYFYMGTLDFSQLRMTLDFIMTNTESSLISSPRIVTMDNTQAEIYIGKSRPIPSFEYNSDTGQYQITGFEEKIEGVTLTVTPIVSKNVDGYSIRLKLNPKVTTFSQTVTFTSLGFDYPVMSERFANTEVTIKDGQTIVIGGLIETQRTETIKKIPLLGDIPFFGWLFKHKSVNPNDRVELLIFVTATVVKDSNRKLVANQSYLMTSAPRPLKLEIREVKEVGQDG